MRANTFTGQLIAVLSRRSPAFEPDAGEPHTFPARMKALLSRSGQRTRRTPAAVPDRDRSGIADTGAHGPVVKVHPHRHSRAGLSAVAALLATVAGIGAGALLVNGANNAALSDCGAPTPGIHKIDGECVGVTDGSVAFRPELADVQRMIADENARVRATSSSYITVAVLDPFTSGRAQPADQDHERLEGAYTALRRVNDSLIVGDARPQIQLLLANEGETPAQWQYVADQLGQLRERPDNPLAAVIGLGTSTAQHRRRAEELSRQGIPMVGALLSADTLDYEHVPGLIKVSPSNRQYVAALRGYVEQEGLASGILVRDTNSEQGTDLYTQTLTADFQQQLSGLIDFPTLQFTGTGVGTQGADPLLFAPIRANICAAAVNGPLAVVYTGRAVDLGGFLDSLERRPCPDAPLTILAAGPGFGAFLEGRDDDLRAANLRVVVADAVNVEGWRQNVAGTPEHFDEFFAAFVADGFDPGHLGDAHAITMHDALLAAVQAARLGARAGTATITASDVRTQLLNLNSLFAVPGAGGTLSFSAGSAGEPAGKPVPVLQYPPPADESSRQVSLYIVDGPGG